MSRRTDQKYKGMPGPRSTLHAVSPLQHNDYSFQEQSRTLRHRPAVSFMTAYRELIPPDPCNIPVQPAAWNSLFRQPHECSLSDTEEAFSDQLPDWALPGQSLCYYSEVGFSDRPLYASHNVNGERIVVGYKMPSELLQLPASSNGSSRCWRQSKSIYPDQIIGIHLAGNHLQDVSLKTLVRFSITAAKAFPKPDPFPMNSAHSQRERSFALSEEPEVDMHTNDNKCDTPTIVHSCRGTESAQSAASGGGLKKSFEVTLPGDRTLWLPSADAVQTVLQWMDYNKDFRHEERLTDVVMSAQLQVLHFETLVEIFATAVAFDLRPRGMWHAPLKMEINARLSAHKPLVGHIRRIYNYLPVDHPMCESIFKRCITSFLQYETHGAYSPAERAEIDGYFAEESWLCMKVNDLRRYRHLKVHEWSKQSMRLQHEVDIQRRWEALDERISDPDYSRLHHQPVANSGQVKGNGDNGFEGSDSGYAEGETRPSTGRGRRPRRKQQAKGSGDGVAGPVVLVTD